MFCILPVISLVPVYQCANTAYSPEHLCVGSGVKTVRGRADSTRPQDYNVGKKQQPASSFLSPCDRVHAVVLTFYSQVVDIIMGLITLDIPHTPRHSLTWKAILLLGKQVGHSSLVTLAQEPHWNI